MRYYATVLNDLNCVIAYLSGDSKAELMAEICAIEIADGDSILFSIED